MMTFDTYARIMTVVDTLGLIGDGRFCDDSDVHKQLGRAARALASAADGLDDGDMLDTDAADTLRAVVQDLAALPTLAEPHGARQLAARSAVRIQRDVVADLRDFADEIVDYAGGLSADILDGRVMGVTVRVQVRHLMDNLGSVSASPLAREIGITLAGLAHIGSALDTASIIGREALSRMADALAATLADTLRRLP